MGSPTLSPTSSTAGGSYTDHSEALAKGLVWGEPVTSVTSPFARSYLDMLKVAVFRYLFWLVLVVVFVTGATRISIFGLGYLLACFYLLLFGTSLLQKDTRAQLVLWDCLILYNVTVIISKNMLSVSSSPTQPGPSPPLGPPVNLPSSLPPALPAPVLCLRGANAEQLLLGHPAFQPRVHSQRLL